MGVTGLWTVVQPVARPVKLETLNRKRLAVDASIWIYQFLKAVRDKEGNALRNSHVVGFFRRICKLLFFGIKPVFVFDGGAPVLKRQTIAARKARREGRKEDAVRTAGKLLAVQMHRRAEEEGQRKRQDRAKGTATVVQEEEPLPATLNYVEEQYMTPAEKAKNRQFRKKDAYHLPNLDISLDQMGAPDDPRIMSQEELEDYAAQFNDGEDVNLYDFSKIDFDSPFFLSLPDADRYNILNAARLRSRLRMGYSKEQLDKMFPNRMAFSKFQIERVKERNDLTQRLMNINGTDPNGVGAGRIAGEKGREYMLVKNDGVEGGWVLGVVSNKDEGKKENPIDLDRPLPPPKEEDSDDSFEDVPVAGMNRLPHHLRLPQPSERSDMPAVQHTSSGAVPIANKETSNEDDRDEDTLFVPTLVDSDEDDQFENVISVDDHSNEDEELKRAIAMSLEQHSDDEDNEIQQAEMQAGADKARADRLRRAEALKFSKLRSSSGRDFASFANARAARVAPRSEGADETANPELRAAFEAGRKMGHKATEDVEPAGSTTESHDHDGRKEQALVNPDQFKGPLPFESIDLGKSLFSKKKNPKTQSKTESTGEEKEEEDGGFDKDDEKKPKPLPPWFAKELDKEEFEHSHIQNPSEQGGVNAAKDTQPISLRRSQTGEVIDLDAEGGEAEDPIEIDESDPDNEIQDTNEAPITMGDVADKVRAEPPSELPPSSIDARKETKETGSIESTKSSAAELEKSKVSERVSNEESGVYSAGEDSFEWEESDYEDRESRKLANPPSEDATESSPEPEFETVDVTNGEDPSMDPPADSGVLSYPQETSIEQSVAQDVPAALPHDDTIDREIAAGAQPEDEFSDPEDEELMRQLAVEAEEHARFASELNYATGLQSAADYERELKQLRTQQKADRRDADEVTNVMIQECQQLLRLFGLPYITAPMEAEAQCAELVNLGLVDGIVTDDSDIFLFGGTRVYKNMFNQAKFVECYLFKDMEKEYGLTREKIIQIAHLLGSDYTDGVPGVGPVTALEIMTEFGTVQNFQEWWTDVQTGIAPTDSKGFKKRFRKNAAKIFLPPGFPDPRVDQAYLKPEVDSDSTQFQWGVPDLEALRQYLMSTIGWSPARTDEILVPVIRDMNKRLAEGTQANMTHFFGNDSLTTAVVGAGDSREAYAPRRRHEGKSTRMETALEKLHQQTRSRVAGGGGSDEYEDDLVASEDDAAPRDDDDSTKTATKTATKTVPKKRKTNSSIRQDPDAASDTDNGDADHEEYQPAKKAAIAKSASRRKAKKSA